MRDQFIRQSKKKLAEHKYAEAIQIVEQIPNASRNDDSDSLLDKAKELDSLLSDIRGAALVEKTSLALADKLVKAVPANADAAKIREQLLLKAKSKPADARLAVGNFALSPRRTHLGIPIDPLAHFTGLEAEDEKVATTLNEHPGEFFVALGLALQGIEQAQVSLNLMPVEKGSLLGKLNISLTARRGPLVAWGLDLSDFALKAIKLSHDPKTKVTRIEACEYILHRKPLTHPEVEMIRGELVDETLRDFAGRHELKDCRICVAVSGHRVLGRFFDLPPMPAKKVPEAVQFEAKHQVPIPLGELRWAYQILNEVPGKAADDQPRRILLVAIRESHVQDRVLTFKSAGIPVDIVQSEAIALHNAAVLEFFSSKDPTDANVAAAPPSTEEAIVLVDIGAETTNVVISTPRATWFRGFGQGGDTFTRTLAGQFHLNHDQAEILKRSPARARRYYQWRDAISPLYVQIASEIERSINSYQKSFPEAKLTRIYGLGGAFPDLRPAAVPAHRCGRSLVASLAIASRRRRRLGRTGRERHLRGGRSARQVPDIGGRGFGGGCRQQFRANLAIAARDDVRRRAGGLLVAMRARMVAVAPAEAERRMIWSDQPASAQRASDRIAIIATTAPTREIVMIDLLSLVALH